MSARPIRTYRFATAAQWAECLTYRFDVSSSGSLAPAERLGSSAVHVAGTSAPAGVPPIAVDRHGQPLWLSDASGTLGRSPRLVADDDWVWAFESGGTTLLRFDRETLQPDVEIDVGLEIRDIASDGRDGVWVLAGDVLLHYDCKARPRGKLAAPCEASPAAQIGTLDRGGRIVLLTEDGKRIVYLDAANGKVALVRSAGRLSPCWTASRMATDARNRIALWGLDTASGKWLLFVLDGWGDTVDGPLQDLFPAADPNRTRCPAESTQAADSAGANSQKPDIDVRLAVHRQTVWFATETGLWRLDPSDAAGARESESALLTPPLVSPDNDFDRGWLRAEISVELPDGAALDVQVATTDDPAVLDEAQRIAGDSSGSSQQRQEAVWALFDPAETRRFSFAGPAGGETPLSAPLAGPRDRWLWLRLNLVTPPGVERPVIRELRVLYPEISIIENIPGVFRGEQNDPTGELRAIVGVLEATTQDLDARIRGIASFLDPDTAPVEWLDYVARWIALPWDDELPEGAKRSILAHAGEILDRRGTRAGLTTLLRALAGPGAIVDITDTTADFAPLIVGCGRDGGTFPGLLAGASRRAPILDETAVLGRARLCGDGDPLAPIVPTLRIRVWAAAGAAGLGALARRVLLQYVPAGVRVILRWRDASLSPADRIGEDGLALDADGPGRVGQTSAIGRTILGGTRVTELNERGLEIGFRLP